MEIINTPSLTTVLFDRDGTLIEDRHYLSRPEQIQFFPGVFQALKKLQDARIDFYIVTNQSGIGRGYFSDADYKACEKMIYTILAAQGIQLADTAYCPHAPKSNSTAQQAASFPPPACTCRKPDIGMWKELQQKHSLSAKNTVMIGDKLDDILFGHAIGCALSILVLTGKGQATAKKLDIPDLPANTAHIYLEAGAENLPHIVAQDVPAAVDCLLAWQTQNTHKENA